MKNDMINNVYIIWLVCSLSAVTLAGATQDKPVNNAADIYQKVFDRYPSKEVKDVEQKIESLLTDIVSKNEDPNEFSKKATEWKANSAYQLKKKIEAYADGKAPLTPEIETYIGQQRPVLDLIRQACAVKVCEWPKNSDLIKIGKIADKNSRMREIYLLVLADARLEVDHSRYKNATTKIMNTSPLIHQAGNSNLLEHLMCIAKEKMVMDFLRDILGQMPVDKAALKILETHLNKENENFPSFRDCILGEKEYFARTVSKQDIQDDLENRFDINPESIPHVSDDYIRRSINYNNSYFDLACSVLDLPYGESLHQLEQIKSSAVKDASIALNYETWKVDPKNILKTNALLTVLSYASLSNHYAIHIKTKTQLHATLVAVKIYQDFAQTGKLPQNLPSDCPVDLFNDKPFEYKINENGFILRSAGKDIGSQKTIEYQFALHVNSDKKSDK